VNRYAKKFKRTWLADEQALARHFVAAFGKMAIEDLKRRDLAEFLETLAQDTPTEANRQLERICRMFNWAIEQGYIEFSPAVGLRKPAPENVRTRVLTDDEIKAFLNRLPHTRMEPATWRALALCLVLGCRAGEASGMAVADLDLLNLLRTIPAERSKNKRPRMVPLTNMAMDFIRPGLDAEGPWVFPSPTGTRGLNSEAIAQALIRNRAYFGFTEHFCSHDLRRTMATGMARLGVAESIVARVLGHVSAVKSVTTEHCNHHDYAPEMRAALERWERHLRELMTGATYNVITMPRRA
jgi:integrase